MEMVWLRCQNKIVCSLLLLLWLDSKGKYHVIDLWQEEMVSARDSETILRWEAAGTAHADVYTFGAGMIDTGAVPIAKLAAAWTPTDDLFGTKLKAAVKASRVSTRRTAARLQSQRVRRLSRSRPS
jgi:hypothetical protein